MGSKIYAYIMILLGVVCISIIFFPPYGNGVRSVLYTVIGLWSIWNGIRRLRK